MVVSLCEPEGIIIIHRNEANAKAVNKPPVPAGSKPPVAAGSKPPVPAGRQPRSAVKLHTSADRRRTPSTVRPQASDVCRPPPASTSAATASFDSVLISDKEMVEAADRADQAARDSATESRKCLLFFIFTQLLLLFVSYRNMREGMISECDAIINSKYGH